MGGWHKPVLSSHWPFIYRQLVTDTHVCGGLPVSLLLNCVETKGLPSILKSQTTQSPHCESLLTGPSGKRNVSELVEDVAYQSGIKIRSVAEVKIVPGIRRRWIRRAWFCFFLPHVLRDMEHHTVVLQPSGIAGFKAC